MKIPKGQCFLVMMLVVLLFEPNYCEINEVQSFVEHERGLRSTLLALRGLCKFPEVEKILSVAKKFAFAARSSKKLSVQTNFTSN